MLFYVKDKVSIARDGYEVAGILKEKIGNEEGFFEFRMLKVEAYSKYSFNLNILPLPGRLGLGFTASLSSVVFSKLI